MTDPEAIELPDLAPMRAEVGNGIAAFSSIESFLALLYGSLMYPAPRKLCYLTFDQARHIESKCRILKAVGLDVIKDEADLATFKNLMHRVKNKADTRHKLAHWLVSHWHKNQPVGSAKEMKEMEPRLIPPYYSTDNLDFSPKDTLTLYDLQLFTSGCHELANDIVHFAMKFPRVQDGGDEASDIQGRSVSQQPV